MMQTEKRHTPMFTNFFAHLQLVFPDASLSWVIPLLKTGLKIGRILLLALKSPNAMTKVSQIASKIVQFQAKFVRKKGQIC